MNLCATKLLILSGYILLQSPAALGQPVANDTDVNQHIQASTPCHSCCPGLPGMPGTPGYGIPGQNGEHGIPGLPGQTGEPGPKGDSGNRGEKGIQGEKGEKGIIGAKGKKGDSGFPGKLGPAGPVGQKGSRGPPGVGVPGAIGPKGEQGEAGPIGMPGSPGPVGSAFFHMRSAFTVVNNSTEVIEPSTTDLIIKLNGVKLNIGSNYNVSTGIFTSTISGVYFFSYSYQVSSRSAGVVDLRKNGKLISSSREEPRGSYGQGGQAATIQLQKNDEVWIQFDAPFSDRQIYPSYYGRISFTGFLLYEI